MNKKANNIIRIPTSIKGDFFRYWLMFLKPFHHLTDRQIDVVVCFLKYRHELEKVIIDNDVLDSVLMNEDSKRKVREECGISLTHFQITMGKLKQNNVIVDGKFNSKFIPKLVEGDKSFQLMLYFDLDD